MRPAYVCGLGLWASGYADPAAWCRGDPDPAVQAPEARLLSGPLRRRASALTRMGVEVMEQATREAGRDPVSIPSVWATAHGEHTSALAMLEMMRRGDGRISPTHFHNSVHNTSSGYASIAVGNRTASTTLTGGGELVAAAFLEALCRLESVARDIVVVLADEPLLPPFNRDRSNASLAVSFCLSCHPDGASAVLSGFRRDDIAPLKRDECFGNLYVSAALPLLEGIVLGRPGVVALEFERDDAGPVACVDLELVES